MKKTVSVLVCLLVLTASVALAAPIHDAVVTGRTEMVEKVLDRDPKAVNAPDAANLTPLMLAAKLGDAAMINLLASRGADINARDASGNTALHHAARGSQIAAVKALVALKGIDLNPRNDAGRTPIDQARARYMGDIVRVIEQAQSRR